VDVLNTEIQVNLFQVEFSERYVLVHCLGGPDLAPMDFAVFPYIKSFLRGMKFDNLSELRLAVMNVIFHMFFSIL
jgi:hypothetical protein